MQKERVSKGLNINYKWIAKYFVYLIMFILLARARLTDGVMPFAFGLLIGLTFLRQNFIMLALSYVLATFLGTFEFLTVITSLVQVAILLVSVIVIYYLKKPLPLYMVGILSILIQASELLFYMDNTDRLINIAITMVVSMMFSYIVINAFCAAFIRGLESKITIDEKICISVVFLALFLGIFGLRVYGFNISTALSVFVILFLIKLYNPTASIIAAILIGIAGLIYNGETSHIAIFATYAIVAIPFAKVSRFAMPAVIICINLALGYYFKIIPDYSYISIVEVIIGGGIFLLFNDNFFAKAASSIGIVKSRDLSRDIINRNRQQMSHRLSEMSDVFLEMQRVFMNMVKATMSTEEAINTLVDESVDKVCNDCLEYNKCHMVHKNETRENLYILIRSSIERGKATILDMPNFLSVRCRRINGLLANINQLVLSYNQYTTLNSNLNSSRVLIGQQMGGVSKIINELGKECKLKVIFDAKKENLVIDELIKNGITCSQAIIYSSESAIDSVNVLVKNNIKNEKAISEVISAVFGCNMMLIDKEQAEDNNWTSYYLKNAPSYDVIFGAAGCKKHGSEASGDAHSLIRLSQDKFILSLCDGMGSGECARRTSEMTMGLIENFYKAGFSNDIILESVNQLLGIGSEENFTAIDICVMDLNKALCDFIKIGGSPSFIKTEKDISIICGAALPMGILEEMRPSVSKHLLKVDDFIIMVTDGITDAFYDENNVRQFISEQDELNPQTVADNILARAIKLNNNMPKDDMTVLVGRIIKT